MNTTSLQSVGFVALVLALMDSSAPRASAATGAAPAVRIQPLPPDAEGAPVFQLEWDAAPQATYLIQTGNFGDTPGLNDHVIVWKTFEAVRPTGFTGSVTIRITPRDSFGNAARSEFFRLVLPGTQIFSVEPAVFPSGAATTVSIVGQCFESNDVVRVDGVPVAGVVYLSPNQFHGPLPTLSVGQHLVELVRGGVVQSSFTVTCADAFANPELVLQGPPNAPPASPSGLQNNPAFQDNKNYGEMPRGHGRDMIIGGGLDLDDDEDGIPDVIEGMARQLPAPISHTRVDSWAAIVEMTTGGGGVSPFSGEVQLGVADMVIPGRGLDFIWARTYNSRIGRTGSSINGWTFSYDVSVASYLQTLGAVSGFLGKGLAHFEANAIDPATIVSARLKDDMLPFLFQVVSVAHHSLGAIEGAKSGVFSPSGAVGELDYAGLQKLVADARTALAAMTPDEINALEGGDMVFQLGERKMPFTVPGFLMSFSIPNLHFHATTAYDILRQAGVPLGKRDYLGAMRMKAA